VIALHQGVFQNKPGCQIDSDLINDFWLAGRCCAFFQLFQNPIRTRKWGPFNKGIIFSGMLCCAYYTGKQA
jgi:hypothetical protein